MKNPEEIYNRLKEIIYNLELEFYVYEEIRKEIAKMLGITKEEDENILPPSKD